MLLSLAGCAAPLPPPKPVAATHPGAATPGGIAITPKRTGTVLAIRTVPARATGPARLLVADLGAGNAAHDLHLFEVIVRTSSGTTIAVVQPDGDGLYPGETVGVLPGAPARIDPLPRS